ncbi:hypothetical protein D1007_52708 [Hordeum vulgare]|nr:hypothetical protein D1007_52708 [Hordeum vulgare]
MYDAFRGAANSLLQLYMLAMGGQKLSFQAGERHAMWCGRLDFVSLNSPPFVWKITWTRGGYDSDDEEFQC